MKTPNHILEKEGILVSFSIAKKINIKNIKNIKNKKEKDIIKSIQKNINLHQIPGLISSESYPNSNNDEQKRLLELSKFSSLICQKLISQNVSKYHICFLVNSMINFLGLNENDFEDFYKKFLTDNDDSE